MDLAAGHPAAHATPHVASEFQLASHVDQPFIPNRQPLRREQRCLVLDVEERCAPIQKPSAGFVHGSVLSPTLGHWGRVEIPGDLLERLIAGLEAMVGNAFGDPRVCGDRFPSIFVDALWVAVGDEPIVESRRYPNGLVDGGNWERERRPVDVAQRGTATRQDDCVVGLAYVRRRFRGDFFLGRGPAEGLGFNLFFNFLP